MKTCDFAYHLTKFFSSYLPWQLNVSKNTVISYSHTFSKLLVFMKDDRSVRPEKLRFSHFSREVVEDFLLWLETNRHCGISTRNQRLAAIKSFFRYVQVEQPEQLLLCQGIVGIRNKKHPKPTIRYLTGAAMKLLLAQPDTSNRDGRRDLAILSLLYDSAARVSEVCDLKVCSLRLSTPSVIHLLGKGEKTREIPLSAPTAEILRQYVRERRLDSPDRMDYPLFTNRQGNKLTRGGVSYILRKYVDTANADVPNVLPETLTPHCMRHPCVKQKLKKAKIVHKVFYIQAGQTLSRSPA
jgi:site-specific recombinase XerD